MRKDSTKIITFLILAACSCTAVSYGSVVLDEEEIIFRVAVEGAEKVFLVGDFNEWNPTLDRMVEKDGEFVIRLFLVPGRYRYMFVADGESMQDTDCPGRDEDGKAFFIFRESRNGYEIVYRDKASSVSVSESSKVDVAGRLYIKEDRDEAGSFLSVLMRYEIDERIKAEIVPGFEFIGEEHGVFRSYLVRGSASYETDRGVFRAFNRLCDLDYGDPLSLFGKTGLFDYSPGLFYRGVDAEAGILFGISARIVYAGRIEGYDPVEEPDPPQSLPVIEYSNELPFNHRSPVDSDILSVRIGSRSGAFEFDYIYRHDTGPGGRKWILSKDPAILYDGFEKLSVHGVWLRFVPEEDIGFEVEFLTGSTTLSSLERVLSPSIEADRFCYEQDWETGHRIFCGLSYRPGRFNAGFSWRRTKLSTDPQLAGERSSDIRNTTSMDIVFHTRRLTASLNGMTDCFSGTGSAQRFWLQKWNFWLDGDELDMGSLPFLRSKGIYEVRFTLAEQGEEDLSVPFDPAGEISITVRGEMSDSDQRLTRVLLKKGFLMGRWCSVHFDTRFIMYDNEKWVGENRFVDTWAGFCWRFPHSIWVTLGTGVSPYFFDRWRYKLTPYGREKYFVDRGLFNTTAYSSDIDMLEALAKVERSLSNEWTISVEAGMRF